MSLDTAIQSWEGLVRISGDHAKVHITGGEPFLYFDRMLEILKQASQLGLTPLDTVETNAGVWSTESELRDQLRVLDTYGLDRLKVSWDVFHEEFIEINKVKRFVHIARDVLGPSRVLVRWEKHLEHPTQIRQMQESQRKKLLLAAMQTDSCRFTGRAAEALAPLVAKKTAQDFQCRHCRKALLGSKGVHVDPFGNVFNGQCSGMVLGNVNQTPLDDLWRMFEPDRVDFWKVLYNKGPFGFLKRAESNGFHLQDKYASKCHLCADIRRFFFDKGVESTIIRPYDCYGNYNS